MARPLRIAYLGALYHVTSRGNAQQRIFADGEDRHAFLAGLDAVVCRFNWLCPAYCLMDNHRGVAHLPDEIRRRIITRCRTRGE